MCGGGLPPPSQHPQSGSVLGYPRGRASSGQHNPDAHGFTAPNQSQFPPQTSTHRQMYPRQDTARGYPRPGPHLQGPPIHQQLPPDDRFRPPSQAFQPAAERNQLSDQQALNGISGFPMPTLYDSARPHVHLGPSLRFGASDQQPRPPHLGTEQATPAFSYRDVSRGVGLHQNSIDDARTDFGVGRTFQTGQPPPPMPRTSHQGHDPHPLGQDIRSHGLAVPTVPHDRFQPAETARHQSSAEADRMWQDVGQQASQAGTVHALVYLPLGPSRDFPSSWEAATL